MSLNISIKSFFVSMPKIFPRILERTVERNMRGRSGNEVDLTQKILESRERP